MAEHTASPPDLVEISRPSARADERRLETPERWVQSACAVCPTGCALDLGVRAGRVTAVRGRTVDRVNRGRLCAHGLHAFDALASPARLCRPLVRHEGALRPASWTEALGNAAERTRALLDRHGPGAIGFYAGDGLTLEEHYTLAMVARAGVGTNHLDALARPAAATAAAALVASFGCEGAPGSLSDLDVTDAVFVVGHEPADSVLWGRVLERRRGPASPRLVVVDTRPTALADAADVHLQPRPGSELALLNGLLNLVIRARHVDRAFVAARTVGFAALRDTVASYSPERVHELCGVRPERLKAAAELLGAAPTLVSCCSPLAHQATAAAVQVNNLALVRGMIGRRGCTVFQLAPAPAAQRECGAGAELPAFLNRGNPEHVRALARHWNVEPARIPHYAPATDLGRMLRYAEEGSLRMLWVLGAGSEPAPGLVELLRRSARELYVVAAESFANELTPLADVVLPAAAWGEKSGTVAGADRTAHLARKAVEPPGEARSHLEVLIDLARGLGLRDMHGAPLVKWTDPEGAFEHFKRLSRGRPCDYSGLSYAKLAGGSGVQWPCNERHPAGCERLYVDGVFATAAERCERWGHDLETGAELTAEEYRATDPGGRARLLAAEHRALDEQPDASYPLLLTVEPPARARGQSGGHLPVLALSGADACTLGVADGDCVEIVSRRGLVRARARLAELLEGTVVLNASSGLTLTAWEPVAKVGLEYAAVRVRRT